MHKTQQNNTLKVPVDKPVALNKGFFFPFQCPFKITTILCAVTFVVTLQYVSWVDSDS